MSDETETLKLNLDSDDFMSKAAGALEGVQKLGDENNLSGLISGLTSSLEFIGGMGAALAALKVAIDATFNGELIEQTNRQFEVMAKNAGIVGTKLKDGLKEAAGGLATDQELIKSATESISKLGASASKLPEIMELSRKVSAAFGGDLMTTFNGISKAVASGNARMLRQYGIIIDNDKAYRDYAKSIGIAVSDLTNHEKKQAILNETLQKGNEILKGVTENTGTASMAFKKLQVSMSALWEGISLALSKIMGPTLKSAFDSISEKFDQFGASITAKFGKGTEQAEAHVKSLSNEIKKLNEQISGQEQLMAQGSLTKEVGGAIIAKMQSERTRITEELKLATDASQKLKSTVTKEEEDQAKSGAEQIAKDKAEIYRKEKIKSDSELLQLDAKNLQSELALSDNYQKSLSIRGQQIINMDQQKNNQLLELDRQLAMGEISNHETYEKKRLEITKKTDQEIKKLKQDMLKDEINALKQEAAQNQSTARGMAAGFKLASREAALSIKDFSKIGHDANEMLTKSFTAGFKAIGDGSKSMTEAMKDAFFDYLGSKAQVYGEELILESIYPPNPLGLAAGGALVAFGSALSSMSGSSSQSTSSGGGGGSSSGSTYSTGTSSSSAMQQSQVQRSVTIQVGTVLETSETKRVLMDMIRGETDATDFAYTQVGQNNP